MLLRKFVLQTAAFAILSALVAGSAQAQTKTSGPKTMTTAPLIIYLGTGTTPAAAGTVRQTFQTAALTIDLGTSTTAASTGAQNRTQVATVSPLVMNFGSQPLAAPSTKLAATTSPLVMSLK